MQFSDELRGSEGETCIVAGPTGKHPGTIMEVVGNGVAVIVKFDDPEADLSLVSFDQVELVGEETP